MPWSHLGELVLVLVLVNVRAAWRYFHDRMLVREFRKISGPEVSLKPTRFGPPELRRGRDSR